LGKGRKDSFWAACSFKNVFVFGKAVIRDSLPLDVFDGLWPWDESKVTQRL
jgi:hypothetical protein